MATKKKKEKKVDINSEKYFLKDNIFAYNFKNRSLSFYKREYSFNLTLSLIFAFVSCLFVAGGTFIMEYKNSGHKVYLTNVNGQTEKYNAKTEQRQKTLIDAYNYRKNKKD